MTDCPICAEKLNNGICPQCGYAEATDFVEYRSLSVPTDADVSLRADCVKKAENPERLLNMAEQYLQSALNYYKKAAKLGAADADSWLKSLEKVKEEASNEKNKTVGALSRSLDALAEAEYEAAMSRMNIEIQEEKGVELYSPKDFPYYINSRCCVLPYIVISDSDNRMDIRYDYVGTDWIFFKKIYVTIDNVGRYKVDISRLYDAVTRDSGRGMVGECIDLIADDEDIAMLREIVASEKTVIRFEGDERSYDYTLPPSDISTIKDVLTVYDYLNMK